MPPSSPQKVRATPVWLTLLVTWGGCGNSPKAPGTVGSLGALPFAAILAWGGGAEWGSAVLLCSVALVFFLGWWASSAYVTATGEKDPGKIVIDEVAGQWLTLAFVPASPLLYLLGFALFRLFDITKPFPVGWVDRRIGGGLGIMLDDILAGIYAAAILWIVSTYAL